MIFQDCPEVHANAAETLCSITRYAPPGLASKISSPRYNLALSFHVAWKSENTSTSTVLIFDNVYLFCLLWCSFIGRLFRHALENSRPKSVLVNSLSVCISLLDPKRLTLGTYHMYNRQLTHGSSITANPETVEGMLGSLGESPSLILGIKPLFFKIKQLLLLLCILLLLCWGACVSILNLGNYQRLRMIYFCTCDIFGI